MRFSALILLCMVFFGCTYRANPGASRSVTVVDSYEITPANAMYFRQCGSMQIRRDLDASTAFGAGMHEMVHAIECSPGLTPRQVLRLYHSAAWPVASQDLLGD